MTKPHEETWFLEGDGDAVSVVGSRDCIAENNIGSQEPTASRYRLLAQAPAMARLLLKLEWGGLQPRTEEPCCPSCDEPARREVIVYDADGRREDHDPGKHADNCELAAVLRAAGVL